MLAHRWACSISLSALPHWTDPQPPLPPAFICPTRTRRERRQKSPSGSQHRGSFDYIHVDPAETRSTTFFGEKVASTALNLFSGCRGGWRPWWAPRGGTDLRVRTALPARWVARLISQSRLACCSHRGTQRSPSHTEQSVRLIGWLSHRG